MIDALWEKLAAPLPVGEVQWRQDGRVVSRDGRFAARFVAYIDAHFVRERLDACAPGAWHSHLRELPSTTEVNKDGVITGTTYHFVCKLAVQGVIREDVGSGDDYKSAATDAFKRAAVRFGVGAELYDYEPNWVETDAKGKPKADPGENYARRHKRPTQQPAKPKPVAQPGPLYEAAKAVVDKVANVKSDPEPKCPKCGKKMWDERSTKKSPRAPDFKCSDRTCAGLYWPGQWPPKEEPDVRLCEACGENAAADGHTFCAGCLDEQELVAKEEKLPF